MNCEEMAPGDEDLIPPDRVGVQIPDCLPEVALLVVHIHAVDEAEPLADERFAGDRDLWLYRGQTIRLLRRYGRMAVEVGRVPSLLGREFFRTRVSTHQVSTFEDAVIFVHDVDQALAELDDFEKKIIGRMVLQDYTQDETAALLGCGRRTLVRRFPETLDKLSEIFLAGGTLRRLPDTKPMPPESCQEGEGDEKWLSDCEHGE
jgi:predicted DNA-binding protein (UPF0251 family)